jgi:hypothetical protein
LTNIIVLKEKLRAIIRPGHPQPAIPFIRSSPGVGKSQAVKQFADELGIKFLDVRCSQLDSTDFRGIPVPDMKDKVTRWIPPEFLPFKGMTMWEGTSGILFLDEINRARPDVLQAIFQLVLDRKVGLYDLMDDWYIVAAGNHGDADGTDVIELDAALKNRFMIMDIEHELEPWVKWAEANAIHDDIIVFLKSKPNWLYHTAESENDLLVTPRSWEKFSRIIAQNEGVMDIIKVTALIGIDIIGAAQGHLIKYLETKETLSGKDILNKYHEPEIAERVANMTRDMIYSLKEDIILTIVKQKEINPKHVKNFHDFGNNALEKDNFIAMFRDLASRCRENAKHSFMREYLKLYKEDSKYIINVFNDNINR